MLVKLTACIGPNYKISVFEQINETTSLIEKKNNIGSIGHNTKK
jgi:hypothetical protein